MNLIPSGSDPGSRFFIFDRWLTRRMANWQNFTFQNCLTHENFIALRIIGPSKLAILRSLTLRHTGSNTSIGGFKIPRVILFGDLLAEENLGHTSDTRIVGLGAVTANSISHGEERNS